MADWVEGVSWIAFGPLKLNAEQFALLTPYEFINMYDGYRWRKLQTENMLASLVTVWIANMAGKSLKRPLTMQKIFRDGRFSRPLTDEDCEILDDILD